VQHYSKIDSVFLKATVDGGDGVLHIQSAVVIGLVCLNGLSVYYCV
jgi:hypothetical protein